MTEKTLGLVNKDILKVIYDNVIEIPNSMYICTNNKDNTEILIDSNGSDIKFYNNKQEINNLHLVDTSDNERHVLIFRGDTQGKRLYIALSTKSKRYKVFKEKVTVSNNCECEGIYLLSVETIKNDYEQIMLNDNLEEIGRLPNSYTAYNYFTVYESGVPHIKYMYYTANYGRQKLTVDTSKSKILSYGEYDINKTLKAVATSCKTDDAHSIAISSDNVAQFRYKLMYNGVTVSKEYEDIRKEEDIKDTNFVYVYEYSGKGVIDETTGKELLTPSYDSIRYIGFNNFICTDKNGKTEYINVYANKEFNSNIVSVREHVSLPIIILTLKDNSIVLYNILNGVIFNVNEFARQFNCEYNLNRPDLIRVRLAYGFKYVTNTLVPITNMAYIKQLNNSSWVKM